MTLRQDLSVARTVCHEGRKIRKWRRYTARCGEQEVQRCERTSCIQWICRSAVIGWPGGSGRVTALRSAQAAMETPSVSGEDCNQATAPPPGAEHHLPLTERILTLTLEIIGLLTEESLPAVKPGDHVTISVPCLTSDKDKERKILEVAKKIVDLLTAEDDGDDGLEESGETCSVQGQCEEQSRDLKGESIPAPLLAPPLADDIQYLSVKEEDEVLLGEIKEEPLLREAGPPRAEVLTPTDYLLCTIKEEPQSGDESDLPHYGLATHIRGDPFFFGERRPGYTDTSTQCSLAAQEGFWERDSAEEESAIGARGRYMRKRQKHSGGMSKPSLAQGGGHSGSCHNGVAADPPGQWSSPVTWEADGSLGTILSYHSDPQGCSMRRGRHSSCESKPCTVPASVTGSCQGGVVSDPSGLWLSSPLHWEGDGSEGSLLSGNNDPQPCNTRRRGRRSVRKSKPNTLCAQGKGRTKLCLEDGVSVVQKSQEADATRTCEGYVFGGISSSDGAHPQSGGMRRRRKFSVRKARPWKLCQEGGALTDPSGQSSAGRVAWNCIDSPGGSDPQSRTGQQEPGGGRRAFSCSECGKEFAYKAVLVQHERVHSGERPFPCPDCGKRFACHSTLIVHRRLHTGQRPFSCSECGKCFSSSSERAKHIKTHGDVKPYLCPECGRAFVTNSGLSRHKKTHSGIRQFSCSECGKGFFEQSQMVVHQRIHTGEKPFLCSECGKCFMSRSDLVKHQRWHTGVKPYSCPECGKSYVTRSVLNRHVKTHVRRRRLVCSECHMGFVHVKSFLAHAKTHPSPAPHATT